MGDTEPRRRRATRTRARRTDEGIETLRNEILSVAADLFGTQGYAATTTRQLTDVLGTTTGGLYYHFESKEDVLFAICESALDKIMSSVGGALDGIDDPMARLDTLIRAHTDAMLGDQNLHRTMLVELRSLSGERYRSIRDMRSAYSQIVVDVLSDCQRAGAVRAEIPTRVMALLLLNTLNWTIFWFHTGGPLTPDELGEWVSQVFVNGTAVRGQEVTKLKEGREGNSRRSNAG